MEKGWECLSKQGPGKEADDISHKASSSDMRVRWEARTKEEESETQLEVRPKPPQQQAAQQKQRPSSRNWGTRSPENLVAKGKRDHQP